MKKRPNLRSLFATIQSLPHYSATANSLSVERAHEIAQSFGDYLTDPFGVLLGNLSREFAYANECGQAVRATHDGVLLYHNAERIFFSHVYDLHYVAQCEDAESARNMDYN